MEELWLDIIGYEGLYSISNLGRVKSIKSDKILTGTIKVNSNSKNKYRIVSLVNKRFRVHRLVALHFLPVVEGKNIVNHIDLDSLNNCVTNLEWVDNRENVSHGWLSKKTSSSYVGVYYSKSMDKWCSFIQIDKKKIHLGTFKSEDEAYTTRLDYMKINNIVTKY